MSLNWDVGTVFDDAFTLNEVDWQTLESYLGEDQLRSLLFCIPRDPTVPGIPRPKVLEKETGYFEPHAFLNDGIVSLIQLPGCERYLKAFS